MRLEEALEKLKAFADEKTYARNIKNGAKSDNQFGVQLGKIRKVAKEAKTDHVLALALWETKNIEARLMATLVIKPKSLSPDELDAMVRSVTFIQVADWLNAYVVKKHPKHEDLRQRWMTENDPMALRAGWSLTAKSIVKTPDSLDLSALLGRIESEMGAAPPEVQWTMNMSLAEIGIHFPEHRDRAIAIGEKLGIYSDYPTSKGCTSPFAPLWIAEMVKRQG